MRSARISRGRYCVMMVVLWILHAPESALSHGTGYRMLLEEETVRAEFYYSGGEPMAYAEILVFGPKDDAVEFQNGRTDRMGRFAFLPDRSGEWRMLVNDGRGHAVRAVVTISEEKLGETSAERAQAPERNATGWREILLGLSLIANLFLGLKVFINKIRPSHDSDIDRPVRNNSESRRQKV
jgi:nickel transport protein